MDIVDRLNGNAPSIIAMHDGAEEIMRLRRELFAAKTHAETAQACFAEARFRPVGDNHHNAEACPYCNPNGWKLQPPPHKSDSLRESALEEAARQCDDEAATYAKNIKAALGREDDFEADAMREGRRCAEGLAGAIRALKSQPKPGGEIHHKLGCPAAESNNAACRCGLETP